MAKHHPKNSLQCSEGLVNIIRVAQSLSLHQSYQYSSHVNNMPSPLLTLSLTSPTRPTAKISQLKKAVMSGYVTLALHSLALQLLQVLQKQFPKEHISMDSCLGSYLFMPLQPTAKNPSPKPSPTKRK